MKPNPRIDLVFSYWIFAWYLLYIFKITRYNPKLYLWLGLIENLAYLGLMIYYNNSFLYISLFIFINTFIKVIPLITLTNTPYKMSDIIAGFILFLLYLGWLWFNDMLNITNLIKTAKNNNPNTMPFVYYASKFITQSI
jgi:hypothetical protein